MGSWEAGKPFNPFCCRCRPRKGTPMRMWKILTVTLNPPRFLALSFFLSSIILNLHLPRVVVHDHDHERWRWWWVSRLPFSRLPSCLPLNGQRHSGGACDASPIKPQTPMTMPYGAFPNSRNFIKYITRNTVSINILEEKTCDDRSSRK